MAIKYKWLADRLKEMFYTDIEKGIEKLPTEQELCSRFRVSRQTVRLSLSLLEEEGLIVKKRGSGSFITGLRSEPDSNIIGILISDDQDYIYPSLINVKKRFRLPGVCDWLPRLHRTAYSLGTPEAAPARADRGGMPQCASEPEPGSVPQTAGQQHISRIYK